MGEFPELKDRKIQAMFKEGAIYLSSFQEHPEVTENIIINDIVHELAHLLEDKFQNEIYSDNDVEKEYVRKEKKISRIIKSQWYFISWNGKLIFF